MNHNARVATKRGCNLIARTLLIVASTAFTAHVAFAQQMQVSINPDDASYSISALGLADPVLRAQIAVEIDGKWISSSSYPTHQIQSLNAAEHDARGAAWIVTFSGLAHEPELRYRLSCHADGIFCEVQVTVRNNTPKPIHVETMRALDSIGSHILNLGGPAEQDRVLSDSFSEDTPAIRILDLKNADQYVHRGVGSQLIYNRTSQWSFFAGAGTSNQFITLLRLSLRAGAAGSDIAAFAVDSTGTTEIMRENSLAESPKDDAVPLSLTVLPGADLNSEQLFFSVARDYHRQLEGYGKLIHDLHNARVSAPVAMGWWSWTAYYYGLNEAAALTNAQWLSQNLGALGFNYFHIDEGYQYARGEYTTPDATLFPSGMVALEDKVRRLGLTPGLWTAPFEVSERSSVFEQHKDWLVHNDAGKPIHLGWANHHLDRLYALDATNPAAQQYIHDTYSTLVHRWGIRYIKLDFMDDSAVEGVRYRANSTAMEAQRIGLAIIRRAVGEDVQLDKDGSAMLNPVGIVDYGRIAQDTGHTFSSTKEAAPAVAARYYMQRNFFVSDPDAFTVSAQTVKDHEWHGGNVSLTLDEAKSSIILSAVAGGMFEIGDDLPALGASPERLALLKNRELLNAVKLGKAFTPVDLMSFDPEDEQPSIFVLKEDARQSLIAIFNWTDSSRSHRLSAVSLGLDPKARYLANEIFTPGEATHPVAGELNVTQPRHSVRVFRLIDTAVHPKLRTTTIDGPASIKTGEVARFAVQASGPTFPPVEYRWVFSDGVSLRGPAVTHAFTQPGNYRVELQAVSLDGIHELAATQTKATGYLPSVFAPAAKTRFVEK